MFSIKLYTIKVLFSITHKKKKIIENTNDQKYISFKQIQVVGGYSFI